MFTSKLQAQQLLEKIVALLVWMAQDFQSDFKTDEIHSAAHEVLDMGMLQSGLDE